MLNKLKNYIVKHYNIIIVVLLVIIFLGSCRSCSKSQNYKFSNIKTMSTIDSLNNIISTQQDSIINLNAKIEILNNYNSNNDKLIENLKDNNNNLKDINKYLKNKNK
jgi:predicted  nucleic acid-binding Zn-ribbon protein